MISFIVIGKNEERRLTECFASIYNVLEKDQILDFEIIYVDSKSTDKSIELVLRFKEIRIFEITGKCNAAIARNIGAKEALGDVLFFIDGDMEILPGFLSKILDINKKLVYPFISGIFEDYEYDYDWNFIEIKRRYNLTEKMPDSYETTTGGLFLVNKKTWELVDGMDSRLLRNEDQDLGLRLTKIGIPLLRKPILAAIHHTQSYLDNNNINNYISSAFYTAIMARKNLFNRHYLRLFIRTQYSAIMMLFVFILMIFISPLFFFGYLFILIIRSYKIFTKSQESYIYSVTILFRRDCLFLFSFLFKYPAINKIEYREINV